MNVTCVQRFVILHYFVGIKIATVICTVGNHTVLSFNLELICTSELFKKLKLHEPSRRVKFRFLPEKLTSANQFQIEREKPYDYLLII